MRFQFDSFLKRCLFAGVVLFFAATGAKAQTWLSAPSSGDWNTGSNWDLGTVPNSNSASATLGSSSVTTVSLSSGVTLGNLLFNASSSYGVFTNGNSMAFVGAGINNISGIPQTLSNNGGNVLFENTSSTS